MSEWAYKKLDEYVRTGQIELGRGNIISKLDIEACPGPYPIYSSSAQGDGKFGEYGKFMFDEELVSWSVDGGGNFFYRPKHQFSVTNVSGFLRIKTKELGYRFLYYSLALQHRDISFDYTTKAHPSVIRKLYSIPSIPKHEQDRIVGVLSTLDETIGQTEALIVKYQQIKAGLMHDLFTRGVTPDGQLRPTREQAPHLYKESPLGWIPKEWEIKRLVDMMIFPSGQVDPRDSPFSNWILIAPDHIEKETGRLLRIQTAGEQGAISGKYTFQSGDIVYSKIRPYLRKAILVDFSGLCSADMYPLRPANGVNARYLLGVVLGDHFSKFAESVSMRSGFPKINRDEMSGYRCAVPSSSEQEVIAEILRSHDALLTTTEKQAVKLRQKKQGLMQDLLTGRVRVKAA